MRGRAAPLIGVACLALGGSCASRAPGQAGDADDQNVDQSAQRFVSPGGDDAGPGTLDRPWRTLQKAMDSAAAGETVNIRAGTYQERLALNVSGEEGKSIVFQPHGWTGPGTGEQVVLDYQYLGTVTDGVPFLWISGRSHVRIQGLVFQNLRCAGASQQGVRIDGASRQIALVGNKFLGNQSTDSYLDGVGALLHIRVWSPARDILIAGNELGHIHTATSEALTVHGATDVTIEGNYIHDTDGIAIDLHEGASRVTVRANTLEFIGRRRDGTLWYDNAANAIYVDGGNDSVVEKNVVRDSAWAYAVSAEPGQPPAHDIVVRDNLAYRCYGGLFAGNWYSTTDGSITHHVQFLNNTLYEVEQGLVVRPYESASVVWKNNIVAQATSPVVNTLGWPVGTMDYNLYFGGGAPGPDEHPLTSDPLFTDASSGDFALQAGSPAVDAGDASGVALGSTDHAGAPRVVNSRVDLGAHEQQ